MLNVIHNRDELTKLPEAPSATENSGMQAPYDTSQHRTIDYWEKRRGEGLGSGGLHSVKFFSAAPSRTSDNALCNIV